MERGSALDQFLRGMFFLFCSLLKLIIAEYLRANTSSQSQSSVTERCRIRSSCTLRMCRYRLTVLLLSGWRLWYSRNVLISSLCLRHTPHWLNADFSFSFQGVWSSLWRLSPRICYQCIWQWNCTGKDVLFIECNKSITIAISGMDPRIVMSIFVASRWG